MTQRSERTPGKAVFVLLTVFLAMPAWCQDTAATTDQPVSSAFNSPNSADALKHLLQAAVDDAKKDDTYAVANRVLQMEIPHDWFRDRYPAEKAEALAEKYRSDMSRTELMLQQVFTLIAQNEGEILVRKISEPISSESGIEPEMLTEAKKPLDFYFASWHAPAGSESSNDIGIGYFTYADSSFRWISVVKPPLFSSRTGTIAPKLIYNPQPKYSQKARKAGIEGKVVVSLVVDAEGVPTEARISQSLDPDLDQKALDAVRTWKFEPAMKNGRPVAAHVNVEVNFRLRD